MSDTMSDTSTSNDNNTASAAYSAPATQWARIVKHQCPVALTPQALPAGTTCAFCNTEQRAPVKLYRVVRVDEGVQCVVMSGDTKPYMLPRVMYHGADWEYGFGGSGPADLALSILADYFGETPTRPQLYHGRVQCWPLHQSFKWAYVARQQAPTWDVSSVEIDHWLVAQEGPASDPPHGEVTDEQSEV